MVGASVAEQVLSALVLVARTNEVRHDLDLDLFEHDLLDSLGLVELMVQLQDRLGVELSPAEIERAEWATPRKIVAFVQRRVAS